MKKQLKIWKEQGQELLKAEKPLTRFDYLLVFLAVLAAFFVFDTLNIVETAGAGYGYLNRQFLNFYEYARSAGIRELTYMPATYVTYAIWNLPLKLTMLVRYPMPEAAYGVILWYKLLLVLFYTGCGVLVYSIAREMGMNTRKAKLCMYGAVTMPVGFFLQFSYGQVMVMPVFFILLGFYYYLKDSRFYYILWFAVAIAYQQLAWVFILPLLLLKEKRLLKLLVNIVCAGAVFSLEYVIYAGRPMFLANVKLFDPGLPFPAGMDNGIFFIQYVIFFWILVLGWAYFTYPKKKEELAAFGLFFIGLAGAVTLGFYDWRPEQFFFLVPFTVLGAFIHRDTKIFMILDILWAVLMTAYVVVKTYGIMQLDMLASLYTVALIAVTLFKHPNFCQKDFKDMGTPLVGWMRTRFIAGAALSVVPALVGMLLRIGL